MRANVNWKDQANRDHLEIRSGVACVDGTPARELVDKMIARGLMNKPGETKQLPNKPPFPVRPLRGEDMKLTEAYKNAPLEEDIIWHGVPPNPDPNPVPRRFSSVQNYLDGKSIEPFETVKIEGSQ